MSLISRGVPGRLQCCLAALQHGTWVVAAAVRGLHSSTAMEHREDSGAQDSSSTSSSSGLGPGSRRPASLDSKEAAKFAALAAHWWDLAGPFRPLHQLNPVRVAFMRDALCDHFGLPAVVSSSSSGAASVDAPLAGLRLLDVGCGGGILAESLARLGAQVTGIDVNAAGVEVAVAHAEQDPLLAGRITYRAAPLEQLVEEGAQAFDAVVASEVVEHVRSLPAFFGALSAMTRPGGAVLVSTLNRTPRSFALAVVGAEYLLRWVPPGTHSWSRFLTPEELAMLGDGAGGLCMEQLAGMVYNPLSGRWSLSTDTAVNYIASFSKPNASPPA